MKFILGLIFIFCLSLELQASAKPKVLAKIPFETVGTYVVLKVHINDNPPLNLLLDSGIGSTIITELSAEDSIVLERSHKTVLKGLGAGTDIQAWVCDSNRLEMGKIRMIDQTIMVLESDIFNLSKQTGTKLNGIIGSDFFENQIIRINYAKRSIQLYDKKGFTAPKGFVSLPIRMEGHKMFIEVPIRDAKGEVRTVHMLIDTGAELAAWFRSYGENPVPMPQNKIHGYIGRGLSGDIEGALGKLSTIWMGGFPLSNAVVAFPDSVSISGTSINAQRDGTIGSQLLSRFDLIFDQVNGKLYLKPNFQYKKPFSYNMAGIEVVKDNETFQLPEVLNVWEKSPGQLAGVKVGDLILEINGVSGFKATLNEVKHFFETNPKSTVRLTLIREGKTIQVKIKLKNVLEESA